MTIFCRYEACTKSIDGGKLKDNYSSFISFHVWPTPLVESRTNHLTNISNITFTDILEEM